MFNILFGIGVSLIIVAIIILMTTDLDSTINKIGSVLMMLSGVCFMAATLSLSSGG